MLKITFVLESSIRGRNTNSKLQSLYSRIYYLLSVFSNSIMKLDLDTFCEPKIRFNIRKNRVVLMRSPFHYKTSKTILARPSCKFYFSLILPLSENCKLVDFKIISKMSKNIAHFGNFSCTKIIFQEL